MANESHIKILEKGVEDWNSWRKEYPDIIPDLSGIDLLGDRRKDNPLLSLSVCFASRINVNWEQYDLSGLDFSGANLDGTNLNNINFSGANFSEANLRNADFRFSRLDKANLSSAILEKADLSQAHLQEANLSHIAYLYGMCWYTQFIETDLTNTNFFQCSLNHAYFTGSKLDSASFYSCNLESACFTDAKLHFTSFDNCDLRSADLRTAQFSNTKLTQCGLKNANCKGSDMKGVDLQFSTLVATDFEDADISGSLIYGTSCWDVKTNTSTKMNGLVITRKDDNKITVDDIEVAQFINLLLINKNIRNVLNSITSKGVLILGRFADSQRKAVLDALRDRLRNFDLLPIVFDFDRPIDRDYSETLQTLVGMSMFVIADLTTPKSIPLELEATVKQFKIPYVPIIDISVDSQPFSMFADLQKSFHWVLPTRKYESKEDLLNDDNLKEYIINPVEKKREELRKAKNEEPEAILIRKKAINAPTE